MHKKEYLSFEIADDFIQKDNQRILEYVNQLAYGDTIAIESQFKLFSPIHYKDFKISYTKLQDDLISQKLKIEKKFKKKSFAIRCDSHFYEIYSNDLHSNAVELRTVIHLKFKNK